MLHFFPFEYINFIKWTKLIWGYIFFWRKPIYQNLRNIYTCCCQYLQWGKKTTQPWYYCHICFKVLQYIVIILTATAVKTTRFFYDIWLKNTTKITMETTRILMSRIYLLYTEFISAWLCRKLLAYRNTLKSLPPGTNQYWAMSVKFLAQGNNGLSLTGFEPMRLAILRSLDY